jgi:hypothetical protein
MTEHSTEALEKIREARHHISEQHGHDPQKIVDYYLELQKKYENRLVSQIEQKQLWDEPVAA